MSEGICLLLGAAGVLFGLWRWWAGRRLVRRLDRMLTAAIDGGFAEEDFDESALSALESRMVRFLRGSAGANRALGRDKAAIEIMIGDISHQTKTPIANLLLYAQLAALVCAVILLVSRKATWKDTLPFAPFFTAGFLLCLILGTY